MSSLPYALQLTSARDASRGTLQCEGGVPLWNGGPLTAQVATSTHNVGVNIGTLTTPLILATLVASNTTSILYTFTVLFQNYTGDAQCDITLNVKSSSNTVLATNATRITARGTSGDVLSYEGSIALQVTATDTIQVAATFAYTQATGTPAASNCVLFAYTNQIATNAAPATITYNTIP